MPTAVIDGIRTRYQISGSGPPLLMLSPGGFAAHLETWTDHGIYRRLDLLAQLSQQLTCIRFDKRESGRAGGRVERVSWRDYAVQAAGLLEHLGIDRAHVIGGCVGCSIGCRLAVEFPARVASLVLISPAGGPRYRMAQHDRFGQHLAFVRQHGLAAVVALAAESDRSFSQDGRLGPWVSVLRSDPGFAAGYPALDPDRYLATVSAMARTLFDRDTVPGCEPEDLLALDVPALVVPGNDPSHAGSAARYLVECLGSADFLDVAPAEQTAELVGGRVLSFLARVS